MIEIIIIALLMLIAFWVRPRKPYQSYKKHPEYERFLEESRNSTSTKR